MRLLVVGGGGREHALCWKLAASPLCSTLFCAPGNPGIAAVAQTRPIAADDVDGLVTFARDAAIDFVVVGPEAPLVAGLVDGLEAAGIAAFGPTAAAAALEGSKGFVKDLCARHGIPTAAYCRFRDPSVAKAYLRTQPLPIVVKADGLAAGKGVVVAPTLAEAEAAVDAALTAGSFGAAGAEIVIEAFLDGVEASVFALSDGQHSRLLASAHDYKRAGDGDTGPNTGGMGAVSPTGRLDDAMLARIHSTIIAPTVAAMAAAGTPFKGVLYAGIMLTAAGPQLLEYNVRFGDPECQALLPRLASDLLPALIACRDGTLASVDLDGADLDGADLDGADLDGADFDWVDRAAVCVVLTAPGYPGASPKGLPVPDLHDVAARDDTHLFHAATARAADGTLVTAGGRVLNLVRTAPTAAEARASLYADLDAAGYAPLICRRDIAAG